MEILNCNDEFVVKTPMYLECSDEIQVNRTFYCIKVAYEKCPY